MNLLEEFGPHFVAMAVFAAVSSFCSCSEAALFSLQPDDRRALRTGSTAQRTAVKLLARPDRLLTAILFWNLMVNIAFFALSSVIGIQLEKERRHTEAGLVAFGSLFGLIVFSEMGPKIVGVMYPQLMSRLVSVPLSMAVRAFDPIGPLFATTIRVLRRLLFPNFQVEPYLELSDLEQAISVSTTDEELASQERLALQNIVQLSDLRADEFMRPRTKFQFFTPPVNLDDLDGKLTPSGYLLVTEPETDDIAGAIALKYLPTIPRHQLEHFAQPVVYVPWCSTVAAVFDELQASKREVAAVINELGETIGIITLEDLLYTVFEEQDSRSARLLKTKPIQQIGENLWRVTGMTSLRRLGRTFDVELPPTKSKTVAGIVQEQLERLPVTGDATRWQQFELQVIEADKLGRLMVDLRLVEPRGAIMTLIILLFVISLIFSAFFSGTETGFYRVTRVRLAIEALGGSWISRALLWISNQPTLFVATALVGNNISHYIASLSVVMAAQRLFPAGGTWVDLLVPIAVAPILFVGGELLPKNLFYDAPNRLLKRCAIPLLVVTVLFTPVTILLWIMGRALEWFTKASPQQLRLTLARRELAELITEGHEAGILRPVQQSLAQAMLAVAGQPVKSFALPAGRVVRVTTTMSKSDVMRIAQRHKRTLLPVEDPQQKRKLVGYLRMVDLYLDDAPELPQPKPLVTLRENQPYLSALRLLSQADDALGHVVSNDGRTIGFVTGRELRLALLRAQ